MTLSEARPTSLHERRRAAVEAFERDRQEAERTLLRVTDSREDRLSAARRLEVLRREHALITERARERLHDRQDGARPRAVVAHRRPWVSEQLVELLKASAVDVVEHGIDNGADAIGVVVVEQPDLVLVEDGLLMLSGEEVVGEMRRYAPHAVIAVQTPSSDRASLLLRAGADAVATRLDPPAEVVRCALALLPGP